MTMDVADANAVSAAMITPYADAINAACDAAGAAGLPLENAALVLLMRNYPTYEDDAPTLVQLGVEWIAETLWCGEDAALGVAARPIVGHGDAILVPRVVVETYFTQSSNEAALKMLQAAGQLLPILLLGEESGLFFAETVPVLP